MIIKKRPEKIENVIEKIIDCIENGNYFVSVHAYERQSERMISLPETLHVLKTGYEEKRKTRFDERYNKWNYAIRGKTKREELDVRIIVSFDENNMLIITVMRVEQMGTSYENSKA